MFDFSMNIFTEEKSSGGNIKSSYLNILSGLLFAWKLIIFLLPPGASEPTPIEVEIGSARARFDDIVSVLEARGTVYRIFFVYLKFISRYFIQDIICLLENLYRAFSFFLSLKMGVSFVATRRLWTKT